MMNYDPLVIEARPIAYAPFQQFYQRQHNAKFNLFNPDDLKCVGVFDKNALDYPRNPEAAVCYSKEPKNTLLLLNITLAAKNQPHRDKAFYSLWSAFLKVVTVDRGDMQKESFSRLRGWCCEKTAIDLVKLGFVVAGENEDQFYIDQPLLSSVEKQLSFRESSLKNNREMLLPPKQMRKMLKGVRSKRSPDEIKNLFGNNYLFGV